MLEQPPSTSLSRTHARRSHTPTPFSSAAGEGSSCWARRAAGHNEPVSTTSSQPGFSTCRCFRECACGPHPYLLNWMQRSPHSLSAALWQLVMGRKRAVFGAWGFGTRDKHPDRSALKERQTSPFTMVGSYWCRRWESNPHGRQCPTVFETVASTVPPLRPGPRVEREPCLRWCWEADTCRRFTPISTPTAVKSCPRGHSMIPPRQYAPREPSRELGASAGAETRLRRGGASRPSPASPRSAPASGRASPGPRSSRLTAAPCGVCARRARWATRGR